MASTVNTHPTAIDRFEQCNLKKFSTSTVSSIFSGIILEGANPGQERAFRKGVQAANQKLSELRFGQSPQITLHPVLKHIEAGNAYAAAAAGKFLFIC